MTISRALLCLLVLVGSGGCRDETSSARDAQIDEPLIVQNAAGRVVVSRAPFALRIEDATGREVLSLADTSEEWDGKLYAPLGLTLGQDSDLLYPVLPGAPDTNVESSQEYLSFSVRDVLDAQQEGEGALLTLATQAPAGRTISLRIAPEGERAFRIDVQGSGEGISSIFATFASSTDEAFHGFGGRRESTNLRGHRIRNWVLDYRYPDVRESYYYVAPEMISSRGYGFLLDQSENAYFRLASDVPNRWRVAVASSRLTFIVAPGDAPRAIAALSEITGRHRLPPAWSMGPTLSRAVEPTRSASEYQQAIADDLDHILSGALPVTAYCFEGWPQLPEELVVSTIDTLRSHGIHSVLYIRSFVDQGIGGTQAPGVYDEALTQGYVAKTKDGAPYLLPGVFFTPMAVLDFTNPAARSFWKSQVKMLLDKGADGFMDDFGEQVVSDMVFADGTTGVTMHNRYPVLQHEATREAVDEFMAEHPEREIFFFTRSGYTGRPGSAAYENATFPGDELTDFSAGAGLPSIIPDMLNRSIMGAYGFTTDIAGYADFATKPTKELYARWSEAAALTPFFRVHNGPISGPRMPWSFDTELAQIWTDMANLHQAFQPYVRAAWQDAIATGMPLMRPLWLVDQASAGTPHNDDEWLLGADVLVAPVVEEGALEREVWLPTGCWQAHGEGAELIGPQQLTVEAALGELPWFRRCGSSPL